MESVFSSGLSQSSKALEFPKIGRRGAYGKTCGRICFLLQAVVESVFSNTLDFRNKWQRKNSDRVSDFCFSDCIRVCFV